MSRADAGSELAAADLGAVAGDGAAAGADGPGALGSGAAIGVGTAVGVLWAAVAPAVAAGALATGREDWPRAMRVEIAKQTSTPDTKQPAIIAIKLETRSVIMPGCVLGADMACASNTGAATGEGTPPGRGDKLERDSAGPVDRGSGDGRDVGSGAGNGDCVGRGEMAKLALRTAEEGETTGSSSSNGDFTLGG